MLENADEIVAFHEEYIKLHAQSAAVTSMKIVSEKLTEKGYIMNG